MPHYFAYGSNLDPVQMADRCPSSKAVEKACLEGYRFCFPQESTRWSGGVAGIRASNGDVVWGVVYELSDDDLLTLDGFEGVSEGRYLRDRLAVSIDGESVDVEVYIASLETNDTFSPSPTYLEALLRGARHHGLPADYLAFLQSHSQL